MPDTARLPEPDARYMDFHVSNVRCANCVNRIELSLEAMPGIRSARVSLSLGRLKVNADASVGREDVATALQAIGYEAMPVEAETADTQERTEARRLLKALAVAAFGAGNVMLFSVAVWTGEANGMGPATVSLFGWLSALVALPVVAYAGRPFFKSAIEGIRAGHANMDLPIAIALLLTISTSLYRLAAGAGETYFEAATTLVFFLLIGRYLDRTARRKARAAIEGLMAFQKLMATVVHADGTEVRVPAARLMKGQSVIVRPGEHIPGDGVITDGTSEIDTAPITGETLPASAAPGTRVFAGTFNLAAPLTIRIDTEPEDTLTSRTLRLMENAGEHRTRYVMLANRAASIYVPVVHGLSALTFLGWWLVGGLAWPDALFIAVSVLIITCPCALALAIPAVQIVANGRLFARGVLVKSADGLERLSEATSALFDKTGTLTTGAFEFANAADIAPETLAVAASLARHSGHPLCRAIVAAYQGETLSLTGIREHAGQGIEAILDGHTIRLGNRIFCEADASDDAMTEVFLADGTGNITRFTFRESLRPDAHETLAKLRHFGMRVAIASGDRAPAVAAIAEKLEADFWRAGLLPEDKFRMVQEAEESGEKLLMVGDGLNDGPALASAYVSMAPASGLDISAAQADFVFRGASLAPVAETLHVARTAKRLMRQNLGLALGYNIIAVPLAMAGFASPPVAAIAMSLSSVIVTVNALRLRWTGED